MSFCDASSADVSEFLAIAKSEGAGSVRIEKKILKSGREIWTLYGDG
jgi:hypothetical protein